ncbi:MAG: HlyD family secretion protein, partial [Nitrospira sp.]|nr:HlyD family secretion protein [Nitrospira sp.]
MARTSFGNHLRSLVRRELDSDELSVDELAVSTKLQSWEEAQLPLKWRFSARLPILLVFLFLLTIIFVPWTQTVTVTGQLSAYTPYERPQEIEAQITGRLKKWHVFEGEQVKRGDLILELEDNDPNFMSPELLTFLEQRKQALEKTKAAALARVAQLDKRIGEMRNLLNAAVPSAEARVTEAENKVREARQKVEAAKIGAMTANLNLERHKQLAKRGLVSEREVELAIQTDVAARADLEGAQANLQAAEQAMKSLGFGRDQVNAEMLQRLFDAEAARDASVLEAARVEDQLADILLRLSNAEQRRLAARITAPADGTVVKMAKVGVGETVRQGDVLVLIAPTSF